MKTKRTVLSLFIFISVFCLSIIFDIQASKYTFQGKPLGVYEKDGTLAVANERKQSADSLINDQSVADTDENSIQPFANESSRITTFGEDLQLVQNDAQVYDTTLGNEQGTSDTAPSETVSDENAANSLSTDASAGTDNENATDKTLADTEEGTTPTDVTTENEVKNTETASTAEKEPVKVSRYSNIGISVAADYVNIRRKASTDGEVVGKLYRDSAAQILDTKGDWYYVESGSVKGYVKSDFIKTGIPDDELMKKYGVLRICVKVDGLNVREKPETTSDKLTVIYMNEVYPIVEVKGDWIKVNITDDKVIGYVKKEFADVIVDFKKAVSKEEEQEILRLQAEERAKKETEVKYGAGLNYSKEDLKLLACLIQAEAGNQSYEGKLAVANIVLNRVKSGRFPNTIKGVIYSPGQFTVAASGSLAKQLANYENFSTTAQLLSIKAARAALEGANNIGSRLYFHSYAAAKRKGYASKSNAIKLDDQLFW